VFINKDFQSRNIKIFRLEKCICFAPLGKNRTLLLLFLLT
jgi:hypothetical protein